MTYRFPAVLCSRVSFRLSVRLVVSRVILRGSTLYCFSHCPIRAYVVDADFRHKGVGTSLLKTITTEDTYRSLLGMLITEEAERFYELFGFRKDPICFMTRKETPEVTTNE